MARRRTSLQKLVVALLLTPALIAGCDRDKTKRAVTTRNDQSTKASSKAHAKAGILEALNPPYVLVENGEAAVVRLPTGCAVVVPSKTGVFKGGVRIYVAKSGDPRKGAVLLVHDADAVGKSFQVDGHEIRLEGGTDTAANVLLGTGDEGTSIALSREADPSKIDVSTLTFVGNKPLNPEDVKDLAKP